VNHSLLDLRTNDISQMIKEILEKMAVNVSFYNRKYFDMHSKLLQHLIKRQEILATTTIDIH
jgi:hypothetical protein